MAVALLNGGKYGRKAAEDFLQAGAAGAAYR